MVPGRKAFTTFLSRNGYNASIVQEPETPFQDHVTATTGIPRSARRPEHPCRAQLWGSRNYESGHTDPSVVGLVYVAAHMPDSGEKESDDGKRFPSDLAKSGAIKKTPDGFTYIDPAQFHGLFAADLPSD
jgi:hypothetical protein